MTPQLARFSDNPPKIWTSAKNCLCYNFLLGHNWIKIVHLLKHISAWSMDTEDRLFGQCTVHFGLGKLSWTYRPLSPTVQYTVACRWTVDIINKYSILDSSDSTLLLNIPHYVNYYYYVLVTNSVLQLNRHNVKILNSSYWKLLRIILFYFVVRFYFIYSTIPDCSYCTVFTHTFTWRFMLHTFNTYMYFTGQSYFALLTHILNSSYSAYC